MPGSHEIPEPCVPAPGPGAVLIRPPRRVKTRRQRRELLRQAKLHGYWNMVYRYEAELIRTALRQTKGNRSEASRLLQLDRVTLIRKLRDYGITDVPSGRRGAPRRESRAG